MLGGLILSAGSDMPLSTKAVRSTADIALVTLGCVHSLPGFSEPLVMSLNRMIGALTT